MLDRYTPTCDKYSHFEGMSGDPEGEWIHIDDLREALRKIESWECRESECEVYQRADIDELLVERSPFRNTDGDGA